MKYALDERAEAAAALRDGEREESRRHLQNAAEAENRAKHELALYNNAIGMIQAIDRAEFQNQMSRLIEEGAENLKTIVDETPDLEEIVVSFSSSPQELREPLLLPNVPDRPLVSIDTKEEQKPRKLKVLSTE
jgi:regulator of protease activity HflC (stomatin/prohibitin superfamily)